MRALYLLVLAGCALATLPLEVVLRARVYRRPLRLLATLLPVVVVFVGWDLWAIDAGQWHYDPRQIVGVLLPGRLPLEELLFFVVVPVCAILTWEAVRICRPQWSRPTDGDEPARRDPDPR